jgi:hypothetical protein
MALVAVGCGGVDDGHRGNLERALADSSVGYCGGECRYYDALSAECGEPRTIEGRTFYQCSIDYESTPTKVCFTLYKCTIDYDSTEPTANVCASYEPADPTNPVMRDREKC